MLKEKQHGKGGGDQKSDHRVQCAPSDYRAALESASISPSQGKRYLRQFDRLTVHLNLDPDQFNPT